MTRVERGCARALQASAAGRDLLLSATFVRRRPWASALFVGERLTIAVQGDDDARLGEWLADLADLDLPLSGHFVAHAEVIERHADAAVLDLLLIED